MKHVRTLRLIPLAALGLLVLLAGCMDFSKFSNDPVEVAIVISNLEGSSLDGASVILSGPENYKAWVTGDGVAHFDSVERGNYTLVFDAPSGYSAMQMNLPIWGGKPVNISLEAAENLVIDPTFADLDGDGKPVHWHPQTWSGSAEFRVETGAGLFGVNAAVVHAEGDGVDGGWGQHIPVERNTTYRLSGWIRSENFRKNSGFGAQYSIDEIGQSSVTPSVGVDEWVYVSSVINSGNRDSLRVLTLVGGWGSSSGTIYFTGVSLVKQ